MVNIPYITHRGLPGIEHVPFGMHACHFYRNRNDLIAAMVPYFIAGTAPERALPLDHCTQLPAHESSQALRAAGLRITGNTGFLTPGDWPTFMEYEQALSAASTAGASSR